MKKFYWFGIKKRLKNQSQVKGGLVGCFTIDTNLIG